LQLLFKHTGHVTSFNYLPAHDGKFGETLLFSVKSLFSAIHAYMFHIRKTNETFNGKIFDKSALPKATIIQVVDKKNVHQSMGILILFLWSSLSIIE